MVLQVTRLDYKTSKTWIIFFLEYGPCVGRPLRDELTRENKCKVYADFFDMCYPLVSGPAPKFHGGV